MWDTSIRIAEFSEFSKSSKAVAVPCICIHVVEEEEKLGTKFRWCTCQGTLYYNTTIYESHAQQQVVHGGGASAALGLGGGDGGHLRRHRSTRRENHFGNFLPPTAQLTAIASDDMFFRLFTDPNHRHTNKQTHKRSTHRQTHTRTDRQTDRNTDKDASKQYSGGHECSQTVCKDLLNFRVLVL